MDLSVAEMIGRLLLASFLGAAVGFERERHDQPAGLRTHMVLTIGASLAMMLSIQLAAEFRTIVPNGDPARLAAQVVSGIGFLGAGAIIRYGSTVRGLTTATSLWSIAIVGLAVGAGYYWGASVASVLLLFVLDTLDRIEKRFIRSSLLKTIIFDVQDRPGVVAELRGALRKIGVEIKALNMAKNLQKSKVEIRVVVKMPAHQEEIDLLVEVLSEMEGALGFEIKS